MASLGEDFRFFRIHCSHTVDFRFYNRQINFEGGSLSGAAVAHYVAFMIFDNSIHYRQAKSGPFANLFGGIEGVKYVL